MSVLGLTHLLNGLLILGVPLGLAIYFVRKRELEGRLFWIGAATFCLSQVGQMPFEFFVGPLFNRPVLARLSYSGQLLFTAVFLGLSAGLFAAFSRYAMYRWWARDARTWPQGLLVGVGHGSVAAVLAGLAALYFYAVYVILRGNAAAFVAAEEMPAAQAYLDAYWSMPWHTSLLDAVRYLDAMVVHIAMSLMVMQALVRRRFWWVWAAAGFQALATGLALQAAQTGASDWQVAGIGAAFALVGAVIVFLLIRRGADPGEAARAGTAASGSG
jgi:uncharacterized membrane protein YhfC